MMALYDDFPIERQFLDDIADKWISEGNDYSLLMNHDLNEDSIVFELGGYKGDWCLEISKRYNCNVFVYEPTKRNYDMLNLMFNDNDKIKVFHFGLSNSNRECEIYINGDTSSIYDKIGYDPNNSGIENISLKDISEVIEEQDIENINLIDMNIEGSEYDVMERLIESGCVKKVDKLQIQFHSEIGPEAFYRRLDIQKRLAETHRMVFNYDFCWELWKRID